MNTIRRVWLPALLALQSLAIVALGWMVWDVRQTTQRIYAEQPSSWDGDPEWVDRLQSSIDDASAEATRAADAAEAAKVSSERVCRELDLFMC